MAALAAWPVPALACTLCDSPQAVSVRERLLPDFWLTLGAVILPVLLLGVILAQVAIGPVHRSGAA